MEPNMSSKYYCYLIRPAKHQQKSFCGTTNDLPKTIEQHDKKKGNVKSTIWEYYVIIDGFKDEKEASSFEWLLKHPTRQKNRPKEYTGVSGRVKSLNLILGYDSWNDTTDGLQKAIDEGREYVVYIDSKYFKSIDGTKIKPNVIIKDIKDFV